MTCSDSFISRASRATAIPILLALGASCSDRAVPPETPETLVLALDGTPVDPLGDRDAAAKVLLFSRTDCPIGNRYAPEIERLVDRFRGGGVEFWMVYPDPDETRESIETHRTEFGFTAPACRDPRHALVRRCGATVTPEAFVFDRESRLLYRGRIDDRFVDFGKTRPHATTHDLERALEAVVAGAAVARAETRAIGCPIAELR